MDTEYTKGFKAGMGFEQERIASLLEQHKERLSSIETGNSASSGNMAIRVSTIGTVIALIKGEK